MSDYLAETEEQRERLHRGRVLIVGVGGLGTAAALQLAAAGVGALGLVDGDAVELSNLHRQLLYRTADVRQRKVLAAARRLAAVYPGSRVRTFDQRLGAANCSEIFAAFDFVIDGTDQVGAKFLINDGAVRSGTPFSHAGVVGFTGQTMTVLPGRSACLRCVFPAPPAEGDLPTCQEAGVVGPVAGAIGLLQATEAIKALVGIGTLLDNRLLTYDAFKGRWRSVQLARRLDCRACGERLAFGTAPER